ncbi:MAG TPA: beta-galactosidase [Capsulimonadaceae bacterium]|jgi:hypothetical protein
MAHVNAATAASPLKDVKLSDPAVWKVDAEAGDIVNLTAVDGCVRVDYDLDVKGTRQLGNNTYKQKTARLLLKNPIALSSDTGRIIFESLGMQSKSWHFRGNQVRLLPIVKDASGESLMYAPVKYPHLNGNVDDGWERWMTPYFYCGEAGAATQDVYEAEGGDRNAWPDGALTLAGFILEVNKLEFGRAKGDVEFTALQTSGVTLPYEAPYAYADSLVKSKGDYRIAMEVANNFQAIPVREQSLKISFDPASLQSKRQRVTIPLGPDDNYWVRYQVTSTDGAVVAGDTLRTQVVGSTTAEKVQAVDTKTAPEIGFLRVNPASHTSGVYKHDEPLNVTIRTFKKTSSALKLDWQLTQFRFPAVIEQGTKDVTFNGPFTDVVLPLKGEANRDAYCLRLTVRDGDKVVDQANYYLGRETDFSKPYTGRTGKPVDRNSVKTSSYSRVSYINDEPAKVKSEDQAFAHFSKCMDEIANMSRYVTYMIDLRDFEVLPGVYDFALLDRVMDEATDHGCTLTIRVGHVDQEAEFKWVKYSRQYNYDGTEIYQHYYGGFSVTDPDFTNVWLRAYRALYDRYKVHPGFQGYYLLQPAGEWTVQDQPWAGIVSGYDVPSREGFRTYLRDTVGLSLDALNKRWGTKYASWSDVLPPLPDFKRGALPDLRMSWVDFCRFKAKLDTDYWFPLAAKAIREYDKNHIIITYGGANAPKPLTGIVDYFHNGGNHTLQREETLIDAWQNGKTGWITEPIHPHRWAAQGDPTGRGWTLDISVYVMIAQAGGGGANLHIYYMPKPMDLVSHYGSANAYDRMERYKPILDELQSMTLVRRPAQIAVLQDITTMHTKHRTCFSARLEDLKRWFELIKGDGLRYEYLDPDHAAQYKLLLPNLLDEEMSDANITLLDKLVREQGSKMVISANTGSYCPERGPSPFQFLKQLGITPPTGAYVQNEPGVIASSTTASPILDSGAKLGFFSLADFQHDMQSDEIKKAFWAWPYRWIPQTDYFGYYRDNKATNGEVLARFPSGGVAISLHKVGNGEVIVFWGIPNYRPELMKGFMSRVATWAGVQDPNAGNALPQMLEGDSKPLGRHYTMLWSGTPGSYTQRFTAVPDGQWFIEELVCDQKYGTYTAKELREKGLPIQYDEGCSPLKIFRLSPAKSFIGDWKDKYRVP